MWSLPNYIPREITELLGTCVNIMKPQSRELLSKNEPLLSGLEMESRVLHVLAQCSTTELYHQGLSEPLRK